MVSVTQLCGTGNMAGLCTWVQGLSTWFLVAKSVKPKQAAVARAQAAMEAKQRELQVRWLLAVAPQ